MKKITQIRVRLMKDLMKRHDAEFWVEKNDGKTYYTYPKGGWMKMMPEIDGKPLEYVAEHDDGNRPLNKITNPDDTCGKAIMGKIGEI